MYPATVIFQRSDTAIFPYIFLVIWKQNDVIREGSLIITREGVEDIWKGVPKFYPLKERGDENNTPFRGCENYLT